MGTIIASNLRHTAWLNLFSVGLVCPTAFPFEAKSQLASSPARNYVRVLRGIASLWDFLPATASLPIIKEPAPKRRQYILIRNNGCHAWGVKPGRARWDAPSFEEYIHDLHSLGSWIIAKLRFARKKIPKNLHICNFCSNFACKIENNEKTSFIFERSGLSAFDACLGGGRDQLWR